MSYYEELAGAAGRRAPNYPGVNEQIDLQRQQLADQYAQSLTQTDVEAQRAQQAWNEAQNAYGLASGSMGQAYLARMNQKQADMAALRAAKLQAEAELELERTKYAQQYAQSLQQAASRRGSGIPTSEGDTTTTAANTIPQATMQELIARYQSGDEAGVQNALRVWAASGYDVADAWAQITGTGSVSAAGTDYAQRIGAILGPGLQQTNPSYTRSLMAAALMQTLGGAWNELFGSDGNGVKRAGSGAVAARGALS